MTSPSPRRQAPISRLAAIPLAVAAAGLVCLMLPAVAAASTGHDGGGIGLPLTLPVASIFSDLLGSPIIFGKVIDKAIFGSILSLFFGGNWQVLLHPYEIIEWLIGLPGTGNTTAFVPLGNNGAGPFAALVKDTQAIGLGLLPLALANNTLHLVSGGIFTRPRDHMNDFGKVFMAACAIIAWPWLFGQAIDLANAITLAMLHAADANGNLWKALGAYFVTAWAGGFLDLLTTFFLIATALLLVGLIVMKIVLMVALAFLLVVGPIAIAFYPFEFLSRVLMLFGSVFLALALIPLGWAVLFALFAAFGASVFGFSNFIHAGLIGGTMKDTFDLICSTICFYLAWKWPFIILSRITSLVGGNVAAAGEAFSNFGNRSAASAARGGSTTTGKSTGTSAGDTDGAGTAGRLKGLGDLAQRFGTTGGAAVAAMGSGAGTYAGYGLVSKGARALGGAVASRRAAKPATAATNTPAGAGSADSDSPASNPIDAAVSGGTAAGFDAIRANARDFTAAAGGSPDVPSTASTLSGAPNVAGGPTTGQDSASPMDSAQRLARDVAMTAALTSAHAPAAPGAQAGGNTSSDPAAAQTAHSAAAAPLAGTPAPVPSSPRSDAPMPSQDGPVPSGVPTPPAPDADPRDAIRTASAATPALPVVPGRVADQPAAPPTGAAGLAGQSIRPVSPSNTPAAAPASGPRAGASTGAPATRPAAPANGSATAATRPAVPPANPPARPPASAAKAGNSSSPAKSTRPRSAAAPPVDHSTPTEPSKASTPEQPPMPVSPPENV